MKKAPPNYFGRAVFSIPYGRYATVTSTVAVYGVVAPDGLR